MAGDGISFAMLRIGNRGYSQGALQADTSFETNLGGARENGLKVGCYFFSQAVSVEEAQEEADFVLTLLDGREMDLPVVFDWGAHREPAGGPHQPGGHRDHHCLRRGLL